MRLGTQILPLSFVVARERGKSFCKKFGNGGLGPPISPYFQPYPLPFPSQLILGGLEWGGFGLGDARSFCGFGLVQACRLPSLLACPSVCASLMSFLIFPSVNKAFRGSILFAAFRVCCPFRGLPFPLSLPFACLRFQAI